MDSSTSSDTDIKVMSDRSHTKDKSKTMIKTKSEREKNTRESDRDDRAVKRESRKVRNVSSNRAKSHRRNETKVGRSRQLSVELESSSDDSVTADIKRTIPTAFPNEKSQKSTTNKSSVNKKKISAAQEESSDDERPVSRNKRRNATTSTTKFSNSRPARDTKKRTTSVHKMSETSEDSDDSVTADIERTMPTAFSNEKSQKSTTKKSSVNKKKVSAVSEVSSDDERPVSRNNRRNATTNATKLSKKRPSREKNLETDEDSDDCFVVQSSVSRSARQARSVSPSSAGEGHLQKPRGFRPQHRLKKHSQEDSSSGKEFKNSKLHQSSYVALRRLRDIYEDDNVSMSVSPTSDSPKNNTDSLPREQIFGLKNSVQKYLTDMKVFCTKSLNDIENTQKTYWARESMRPDDANHMILQVAKIGRKLRECLDKTETKMKTYHEKWCTKTKVKNVLKTPKKSPQKDKGSNSRESTPTRPASPESHKRSKRPDSDATPDNVQVVVSDCNSDEIFSDDETRTSVNKTPMKNNEKHIEVSKPLTSVTSESKKNSSDEEDTLNTAEKRTSPALSQFSNHSATTTIIEEKTRKSPVTKSSLSVELDTRRDSMIDPFADDDREDNGLDTDESLNKTGNDANEKSSSKNLLSNALSENLAELENDKNDEKSNHDDITDAGEVIEGPVSVGIVEDVLDKETEEPEKPIDELSTDKNSENDSFGNLDIASVSTIVNSNESRSRSRSIEDFDGDLPQNSFGSVANDVDATLQLNNSDEIVPASDVKSSEERKRKKSADKDKSTKREKEQKLPVTDEDTKSDNEKKSPNKSKDSNKRRDSKDNKSDKSSLEMSSPIRSSLDIDELISPTKEKSNSDGESGSTISDSAESKAKAALLMSSNSDDSGSERGETPPIVSSKVSDRSSLASSESDEKNLDGSDDKSSERSDSLVKLRKKRRKFRIRENCFYKADIKLRQMCQVVVKRLSKKVLKRYSRALRKSRDYVESQELKRYII